MFDTKKKVRNFTEGPILPQIIKFSIPLMITGILQLLFNTADTIVVGRWGGATPEACEAALGAVGSCGSLINLLTLLFLNIALGAGVTVAQDIGAQNYKGVEKTVHTSVAFSFIASLFVMSIGILLARPLLRLMGTDEAVLNQAVPYITAYFFGLPAKMVYNFCASILRSAGDTMRPMIYLTISGVVNIVINLIMVLVFKMGALGVGIATAASFWVVAFLTVGHMIRSDGPYHLDLRKLKIDKQKLKKILKIGIPAGISGTIFSVSHVLIQSSVNSLGTAVVAGNAATANIEGYIYQPMIAFSQAGITFVGQHKGAQKYKRMKKCILWCLACTTVVGLILSWTAILMGPILLSLYVPGNTAAIAAGMARFHTSTTCYFILGCMELGGGILSGLGHSSISTIDSISGSVVLRVIWILFLFPLHPTIQFLYLSFPVTWIITTAAHFIIFHFILKKEIREARLVAEKAGQTIE